MANGKQMVYTKTGYDVLIKELEYLKGTKREEIKEEIATARSFGDLSENSEYDEARNEQAKVEVRIKELEELIENAVIVDESAIDTSIVSVGSHVKVFDSEINGEVEYNIVGSNQADPMHGNISDQAAIGKALIGTRAGDEKEVELPDGSLLRMKVLEVTRTHN